MSKIKLTAPLDITEEISGIEIKGVSQVDISNNYTTMQSIAGDNFPVKGPTQVNVVLMGQFKEDTRFDVISNPDLFTLKFILNGSYYLLENAFIQSFNADVEAHGNPCFCELHIGGTNLIDADTDIEVEFKDQTRDVPVDAYVTIKDKYKEPMDMSFSEFKKAMVIEAL